MELLFSYGTLQQERVQLETFGRKLAGTCDALCGYIVDEVEITDPHVLAASGKRFHPILRNTGNPENAVPGMVFELTREELLQADQYEVDAYQRVLGSLESGRSAWIYAAAENS